MKVYKYGCRPPILNADKVDEQMWLGHQYRNKLTEIELERRKKWQSLLAPWIPEDLQKREVELAILADEKAVSKEDAAELKAIRAQIKTARTQAREQLSDASAREVFARAKDAKKAAMKSGKGSKAERVAFEAAKAALGSTDALAAVDHAAEKRRIEERAAVVQAGLYWGSYLLKEKAALQARKQPRDPRFRRWSGDGEIGVQLQDGLACSEAWGNGTMFRLRALPPRETKSRRSQKRVFVEAWVRIGSDGRKPVWAVFPCILHRPLPDGGIIKLVTIVRKRIGYSYVWRLLVTVGEENAVPMGHAPVVGVKLCWRTIGNDVRVAYAVGQDGEVLECRLSGRVRAAFDKVDDLQSIIDKNFNLARDEFVSWLHKNETNPPEWLSEETKTLAQWRSPRRLAKLLRRWKAERFDGDSAIFERMEAWRYRYHHLYEYRAHLSDQVRAQRLDVYRVFSKQLATHYRLAVLNGFTAPNCTMKHVVAMYSLRQCIAQAMAASGGSVIVPPVEYEHERCPDCGRVPVGDAGTEMVQRCWCGATWEQDENAAENLLRYAGEGVMSGPLAMAG